MFPQGYGRGLGRYGGGFDWDVRYSGPVGPPLGGWPGFERGWDFRFERYWEKMLSVIVHHLVKQPFKEKT